MRSVKKVHRAVYAPVGDLVTYRALPTPEIDYIDPFLFLNHHGPQIYKPHNRGLPFGPHPHRGMETLTFILDGDITHQDSGGHQSVITAGGLQWMRAGRGLIHSEISSDEFKEKGGPLEILQLWLNLPARLKMSEPFYIGKQKDEIPRVTLDDGKVTLDLIFGDWNGQKPAFESTTGIHFNTIYFKEDSELNIYVPVSHNIFFYVVSGEVIVNGKEVRAMHLAEFDHDGEKVHITSAVESIVLFGHAEPFNEPVVSQGPFVMNTREEIMQAYDDYHHGRFGNWPQFSE